LISCRLYIPKRHQPSTLAGEFAQLLPGSPGALNFAGSKNGTSLPGPIFENSRSVIDNKSAINWQISGTPQMFSESAGFDDLSYGLTVPAWPYNIRPHLLYQLRYRNVSRNEVSNHYVRQVIEQEVFLQTINPPGSR